MAGAGAAAAPAPGANRRDGACGGAAEGEASARERERALPVAGGARLCSVLLVEIPGATYLVLRFAWVFRESL